MTSFVRSRGIGLVLVLGAVVAAGCAREPAGFEIPTGTNVSVERKDGATVAGRLVDVQPQEVVLEQADGQRTRVQRSEIRALQVVTGQNTAATPAAVPEASEAPAPPSTPTAVANGETERPDPRRTTALPARAAAAPAPADRADADPAPADRPALPEYRDVKIPAGTVLPIELRTAVGSATSEVEDPVRGTLRRPISIDGLEVVPAGATVVGTVTEAERAGRVKGRARVAFRFTALDHDETGRVSIRTATIAREAEGTKKEDAAKIGGGAAAGAVIGGLLGGGDGAAKGAAIGGGAGTGVVLATRGKEVALPAGTAVSARLTEPVTVRIQTR